MLDRTFRGVLDGFAQGYSLYVRQHRESLPAWVIEITAADALAITHTDAPADTASASIVRSLQQKYPEGAPAPAAPRPPVQAPVVEEKPAYAMTDSGWKKASELIPGCVSQAVVPPTGLQRIPEVTVKFAVAPDGAVDRFEDVTSPPASQPVVTAVRRAVYKCDFVPGRDPSGKLAYTWMILTVRSPSAR